MREENQLVKEKSKTDHLSAALILDDLPLAVYTCDARGYITSYNEAAAELWGRKPDIGKDLWCGSWKIFTLLGEPLPLDACPMARTLKEGVAVKGEEIIVERPDGIRKHICPIPVPKFDHNGKLIGAVNTLIDLTQQIAAYEKQANLAAIVNTSDDAIISKTLQGIITSWNKAAEKMFGYTEDEAIGKHITMLIPPDRLQEEDIIIGNISKGNKIDHFETIRRAKSGEDIHISLSVSPIKDRNGNITGASKIARDVSALKTALDKTTQYAKNLEIINSLSQEISQNLDIESIHQKLTDATTILTGAQFGAFFYNAFNTNGESYQLYTLSGAPREAFEKFGMPRNTAVFNHTFSGLGIVRVDDITKDERYGKNRPHHGMPKGHLPVVSYMAVPVKTSTGEVTGGLFFGHPEQGKFTEEQENLVKAISFQASAALENAKLYNEVVNLNSKKDEFIGMASHELKTPLTSIMGYLQILHRLETTEKSKTFISKTVQQVKKLSSLVADLLDVSKIEAGKLQLVKRDFELMTIIEDAIELIQNSQTSHNIVLKRDLNTISVNADPQRIEQLVINLLTNAVKYSPAAQIVEVLVKRHDDNINIGVRDQGIGIPIEKQKHIFTRFYRVDGVNPSISGLGIGLYICKEVVDRHNGKIWVESTPGQGSTFWFTLPL
ncbi:MAG: sensor histidine kinase [Daejeonella sp.]